MLFSQNKAKCPAHGGRSLVIHRVSTKSSLMLRLGRGKQRFTDSEMNKETWHRTTVFKDHDLDSKEIEEPECYTQEETR